MRHLDKDTVLNKINLTVEITKGTPREILERHNPSIGNIPILGGRVIYGANKYPAEINIIESENTVIASVKSSGITLIDMKINLQNKVIDKVTDYNSDGWIAAKCEKTENIENARFETLNLADVNNFKIHELHTGEGKVKLGSNKLNPLGNIPFLKIKNATFQIDSWVLGNSLIIHNYKLD